MGGLITQLLIIDDDADVRGTISDYLEGSGYAVIQAANGAIGLELFSRNSPDAVLLDLHMPGMDGLQVLEKIVGLNSETPVIVISGQGTMDEAIEALKLGAWDYLVKPIHDLALLSHTLNNALKRADLAAGYRERQEALREFLYPHADQFDGASTNINVRQQTNYRHLEKALYNNWQLGKNVILSWCRRQAGLEILVVPHDFVATFHADHSSIPVTGNIPTRYPSPPTQTSRTLMRELIGGSRQLSAKKMSQVARVFEQKSINIEVPYYLEEASLDPRVVDAMIKRYSPASKNRLSYWRLL